MSDVPSSSARPGSGSKPSTGWQPPTLEDMQAMLPQYQFVSLLGRGGMGAVYKAVQITLDRPVAIKVLPGDLIDDTDAQFAERFKNEAQTMAKMNHPSIVNVYDFGETNTGLLYIVMEFIDGTDVSKMIASQGKLPENYALSITAHVCDALAYAHRNGVIHRDIKPANILINMEGAVKVADFGLAKQNDPGMSGLTKTNMAMGTPDFVAPEALIPGVPLDGRADLYAIGVMLYQMLTGEIPRGMWTMPGMKLGTDPRFDSIIAKAMQTDRECRYQSAAELRRDLDTILTTPRAALPQQQPAATAQATQAPGKPVSHGPRQPQQSADNPQAPPPRKANLGMIIGLGAAAVLLVGGYVIMKPAKQDQNVAVSSAPKPEVPAKPTPKVSSTPPSSASVLPPLPKRAAKQTLDLLALTDPVLDRVPVPGMVSGNQWKREGAELAYEPDGKSGKLAVPVAIDCADYEIEFKARKHSGNDRIHVDIPLRGGRILPIVLNAPGRKVLNEKQGGSWWGGADAEVQVSIRVIDAPGASDRIRVQQLNVKGNPLADWSGDLDSLGKAGEEHPSFPKQPVTSVFVKQDKYAVQQWTLRVFEGEAKVLREAGAKPAAAPDGSWARWTGPGGRSADQWWTFSAADARATQRTTLWSPETYSGDMEVELEWYVGRHGNGGLFYHAEGANELGAFEMQLADRANAGVTWTGGLYGIQGAKKDNTRLGQWNTAKLVIRGAKREHWINGELVCSYDLDDPKFASQVQGSKLPVKPDVKRRSGRLVLQANGGEVAYRNLVVRLPATKDASAVPTAATPSPAPSTSMPPTPVAPAANDPVSLKLADLESKFQTAFERDAGAAYKAQVAKLNTGYVAALDRELAAATKAGKLDDAVTLREEKQRIAEGKGLPPEDLDSLPESLKKLRATWRGAEAGYAKTRDSQAAPLFDAYDKALDTFQIELTKQNKIDDALRVKAARDELAGRRGSSAPPKEDAVTPSKPTSSAPSVATPVESSSSWRRAAEWVLSKGGEVRVRRNGTGDANVRDVKDLPSGRFDIVTINLNLSNGKGAEITDDDLTRFNGLRGIEVIQMSHLPGVTGAGMAAFASSADSVREINLYQVGLQPQHVGFVTQFKELKTLTLNSLRDMTSESLIKLGALKELRSLQLLQLPGLDDRALLALEGLVKLESLDTSAASFTDEGLAALKGMKELKSLNLSNAKGVRGPGLVHIAGATRLTRLNLSSTRVSDDSLAAISGLTNLTNLDLANTAITSACLKHLAPLKQLDTLNLSAEGFTGAGLDALADCTELRTLECGGGGGNPPCNMTDEGLRDLSKAGLPKLEKLSLKGKDITDDGYVYLASFKGLKSLSVDKHPGILGLQAIASLDSLQTLSFGGGPIGDVEAACLTALKSLKNLSFYECRISDAALPGVLAMPSLKSLFFYKSQITPEAIEAAKKTRPDLKIGR